MEGNLMLLNYADKKCDTGIPLSEVESLTIVVLSGDEVATVKKTTGEEVYFDSAEINGNFRWCDFYDGTYNVSKEELEDWTKRKTSYDW